jgi:hypothetical protein
MIMHFFRRELVMNLRLDHDSIKQGFQSRVYSATLLVTSLTIHTDDRKVQVEYALKTYLDLLIPEFVSSSYKSPSRLGSQDIIINGHVYTSYSFPN